MIPAYARKPLLLVAGTAGVIVIGVADYLTGYEVRIFPLYFLPVAFVAWDLSRASTLALAAMSAATWACSNWLAGKVYASSLTWPINVASQLAAFAVVGLLVTELRQRLRSEQDLSRCDSLTSLPNSRAFFERGELLLAIARRSGRPLTLAYLDLDNFKAINDERGHREGDRALNEAAEALRSHFRSSDLVARMGGDEFAALLIDTGVDGARTSLGRVHELVDAAMQRNGWPATVSVGAVCYVRAPLTLEGAIHEADTAMYRAKRSGKNRVHIEVVDLSFGTASDAGDESNHAARH
jgi:diguanylate cyclase (GGDEF)-like protein